MEGRVPIKVPYFDLRCKFCGSRNLIKYGHFRGILRLFCKDCQRKFADNDALPGMQTPIAQVGSAIGMYYEGQSLNSICRLLTQIYGSYPSDSTVYRWITKFTRRALQEAKGHKPNTIGNKWIADEIGLHPYDWTDILRRVWRGNSLSGLIFSSSSNSFGGR